VWKVLAAALLLLIITALAWRYRERHRYLLAGWLWYVVAMIPMIGVVQVGRQAMADRYAYLPFVGLFVMAVWGCAELFAQWKLSSFAAGAVTAAVLLVYASMAFLQINYWHNSYTLFSHALAVTSHNGIAEDNLGTALMEMGRPDLAQPHFESAAEFVPQLSTVHYNLGVLQQQQNHPDAARREYELALKYSSDATEAAQTHSNLGFLLLESDPQAAIEQFTAALQINPDKQNSLLGRGIAEYRQKNLEAAVADLSRAAQIAPLAQADFWLGRALEDKGQPQAAASAYAAALQLAPGMAEAQQRLDGLQGKRP
jgi:tetratricopeptide (TPR) repeat protein